MTLTFSPHHPLSKLPLGYGNRDLKVTSSNLFPQDPLRVARPDWKTLQKENYRKEPWLPPEHRSGVGEKALRRQALTWPPSPLRSSPHLPSHSQGPPKSHSCQWRVRPPTLAPTAPAQPAVVTQVSMWGMRVWEIFFSCMHYEKSVHV